MKINGIDEKVAGLLGTSALLGNALEHNPDLMARIRSLSEPKFASINEIYEKQERATALKGLKDELVDSLAEEFPEHSAT